MRTKTKLVEDKAEEATDAEVAEEEAGLDEEEMEEEEKKRRRKKRRRKKRRRKMHLVHWKKRFALLHDTVWCPVRDLHLMLNGGKVCTTINHNGSTPFYEASLMHHLCLPSELEHVCAHDFCSLCEVVRAMLCNVTIFSSLSMGNLNIHLATSTPKLFCKVFSKEEERS